ncbi:16S rRNA (cytosine1402-N4)-methyltransferase [Tindallia magadiensis]|uniref:Ribosomal RNA small subunit methyltransferase H n=1 Tax=Tindallia magadiensis TaxID=69895 RepID=A0A1I3FXH7_9FIRM|nr:16S rRNA (cytosine(1402)-N(4))-methyltransferase RsmH [Tindallia magadiensis]SFI15621.1 16S rRNA (cytosine1402-N4)-methyltransferase [Tindallia magadiensis]
MSLNHESVLLSESLEYLNIKSSGIYVDGTLGGAGHTSAIAQKLGKEGLVIGIDRDEVAIHEASNKMKGLNLSCRYEIIHDEFANIKQILSELSEPLVDGILLDLGVSSFQLDEGSRGFSYMKDASLDMRMDQRQTFNAGDVVNGYSEEKLHQIIKEYGEEKWAKRVASFIVESRQRAPIETSFELVEIIKNAIPAKARREGPHPAKRTFQAIRMEVNQELQQIKSLLMTAIDHLKPGGRLCVISFHSLEDRMVKSAYKELQNDCICPVEFPECKCQQEQQIKIITRKPIIPSESEIAHNPRARSAKLRVAEKI